jgi:NAD(P)-dependent dehydrogenase (short-subunit alcohol dehydrogenase family)
MAKTKSVVVIGGTSGIGREVARHFIAAGDEVVLTGRDRQRAQAVAKELGGRGRGLGLDLAEPERLAERLADVERVDALVIAAIERDINTARDYSVERARRLITVKLIGYTQAIHVLLPRMGSEAAVVLFGGQAKERPYPGSTTVTTVNGGVSTLIRTLAVELAPVRFNAVHPGIVGDSPVWSDKAAVIAGVKSRTPGGRLATTADVVDAVAFLVGNRGVNGVNLAVDGGWLLM